MKRWTGFAFAALLLFGLPISYMAAEGTHDLDAVRAKYRRPVTIPFPEDNPYTKAKADLGKMLFFDPLLSGSHKHSCSSCHLPAKSWGDGLPHAIGEDPAGMEIRTPTLIDIAFVDILGWDGKFPEQETKTNKPQTNPQNKNNTKHKQKQQKQTVPRY